MSVVPPASSDHDHPLPELAATQELARQFAALGYHAETTPSPFSRSSASGRQVNGRRPQAPAPRHARTLAGTATGPVAARPVQPPRGAPAGGTLQVVRTRRGWAVQFEDGTRTEDMSKRAAGQRLDRVTALRAELAAAEAEKAARLVTLLKERGIGEVDYRKLQPGDLFTWRPEVSPKTVTRVSHFGNGASLIYWDDGRTPAWEALTLMTPSYPAYGQISEPLRSNTPKRQSPRIRARRN